MPEGYSGSEGPKVVTTQMSTSWQMDEQNVVYLFSGILFSHKKQRSTDACYMYEPWRHPAKWKKQVTKDQVLWDPIYMKCMTETRLVVA